MHYNETRHQVDVSRIILIPEVEVSCKLYLFPVYMLKADVKVE